MLNQDLLYLLQCVIDNVDKEDNVKIFRIIRIFKN